MEFLTGKVKPLYIRYLVASFGSTLIAAIYSIVDTAMVGQYHGPNGPAALAVFAPLWNIIYGLGLLMGMGGSILFSTARGQGQTKQSNEYFTAAVIGEAVMAAIITVVIVCFSRPLLVFFGADDTLLQLAQTYLKPVLFTIPCFMFNELLSSFLRNDGNPSLATGAVLFGGIFNVFGDYFFVFTLDMGILGAGLATAAGSAVTLLIMLTHFLGKKNTLSFVWPTGMAEKLKRIVVTGFSTFIIDIAMGILTVLFNRQIMKYLGADALAVYAIIVNINTFVQCCAYSVGQAAQPIISANFGARQFARIRDCLRYALYTTTAFGLLWTALSLAVPELYVKIFMTPTEGVLSIAPGIIRAYSLSFLLLPLNVFSTYYFQAILQPGISFAVSVSRGFLISGILIFLLPTIFGPDSIWLSMLITEALVALYVIRQIRRFQKMR